MLLLLLFQLITAQSVYGCAPRTNRTMELNPEDIGGDATTLNQYPYIVQLEWASKTQKDEWQLYCEAVIISDNIVLTLAQCVNIPRIRNIPIRFLSKGPKKIEYHYPVDFVLHENYNATTNSGYNNVALVKVQPSFEFSSTVRSIQIRDQQVGKGQALTAVGFGPRKSESKALDDVRKANVIIISRHVCNLAYEDVFPVDQPVNDDFLCGFFTQEKSNNRESCIQESGAPLVADGLLAALATWDISCAEYGQPPIFVNIPKFAPWIEKASNCLRYIPDTAPGNKICVFNRETLAWAVHFVSGCVVRPGAKLEFSKLGGKVTDIEHVPHQVQLQWYNKGQWLFVCGGAIYKHDLVLTAGHCVRHFKNNEILRFLSGSSYAYDGTPHNVSAFFAHDGYADNRGVYNDLALVKVSPPFKFSKTTKAIQIVDKKPKRGGKATVSGWGATWDQKVISRVIRIVDVEITDLGVCSMQYNRLKMHVDASILCGVFPSEAENHRDSCVQESGAPLVIRGKLAGLASFDRSCQIYGLDSLYTNVARFKEWIEKTAKRAGGT